MMFICRYSRARMTAYIHGELSLVARRRVARHLDECPRCSAIYTRERALTQELERSIPLIGTRQPPDFSRFWENVQIEIRTEAKRETRPFRHLHSTRYGLVALGLLLALVLPLTMGNRSLPFILPTQPAPQVITGTDTPHQDDGLSLATTVALRSTGERLRVPILAPILTPAPGGSS
jgi:hypothetical protein